MTGAVADLRYIRAVTPGYRIYGNDLSCRCAGHTRQGHFSPPKKHIVGN